jgi:hypothetical protein
MKTRQILPALSMFLGFGLLAAAALLPERPAAPADLSELNAAMVKAATAFWEGLTPEQRGKAGFEWKDAERLNWHFIPRTRKGLPVKEMSEAQRKLAHALLQTGLSESGYQKATTIMSLESILKELEGPTGKMVRDPELYYFSVFGKPGGAATWAWRCEGHHLALNFTVVGGKFVVGAPAFFGTNPALVKDGPRKGLRVLGADEELGRKLVKALNADQSKVAVFDAKAPADVLLMPGKKPGPLEPPGIAWGKLDETQQGLLWKLVEEYAGRLRGELARQDLEKIAAAGKDKLVFAWAGGLEQGQGHYYRVQGPTFTIEYDNTQNGANHVHSLWHDHADNFAENLLKRHLEQEHSK